MAKKNKDQVKNRLVKPSLRIGSLKYKIRPDSGKLKKRFVKD